MTHSHCRMTQLRSIYLIVLTSLLNCYTKGNLNSDCGGILDEQNSTFKSPNFPDPYGSNINCTWKATIPGGMFLIFDEFYLDGNGDEIIFEDSSGVIGKYQGIKDTAFIIQTLEDELSITFTSGHDSRKDLRRQFSGIVQEECKNIYEIREFGFISTPITSNHNESAVFTCTWQITNFVGTGSIFSIQTAEFTNTTASLQVYEGFKEKLLGNFTADNPAHAVVTSNSQMFINLTYNIMSPPSITGLFQTTSAECTKKLKLSTNAEPMEIGYPEYYGNDLKCWWLIEADPDCTMVVEVSDVFFDDEDKLVFYSSANRSSEHLAELTGIPSKLPVLVTSGNMMLVSFSSDDMGVAGNFSFKVFAQDIGGILNPTPSDKINIKLHKNKRIFHLLQTSDKYQPVVTQMPQSFPTAGNLSIRFFQDSWTTGEPLVTQTPASGIVPVIFSNTATMLICAEGFDNVNGSLAIQVSAAPSGTNVYSNKMEDSFGGNSNINYWIIDPPSTNADGAKIEVSFQDLPQYVDANVTIMKGLTASQSHIIMSSFDSINALSLHLPLSDPISIKFTSAEKTPRPFFANYHVIENCNESVNASKRIGSITSEHFPSAYPLNAICMQTLSKRAANKRFHLTFDTLKLAANHSIQVTETKVKNGFKATYMGAELPDDIVLNSSNVQVTLKSEMPFPIADATTDQGFKIDYTVLDCGGNQTAKTGKISTPGFPKNAKASITCVWIVTVPLTVTGSKSIPSIVVLKVNGTQLKGQTRSNYVTIHDGPNIRSPLVNISALNSDSSTFKSTGRSVVITYVNGGNKGFPFQITYSTHDCNNVCNNGICLHDSWRCDGIDQCGDSTDEQDCPTGLYSKKTLGLSVFFAIILTVIIIVVVAVCRVRYKRRKAYKRMDDSAINT